MTSDGHSVVDHARRLKTERAQSEPIVTKTEHGSRKWLQKSVLQYESIREEDDIDDLLAQFKQAWRQENALIVSSNSQGGFANPIVIESGSDYATLLFSE